MLKSARWVALGGILGSLLRWGLSAALHEGRAGTLAANLLGVSLAAFFLVLVEHHGSDAMRHLLLPGFCGGLTTFSAVTLQSVSERAQFTTPFLLVSYFIETVILSLLVVAVVIKISRKVFAVKN